MGNDKSRFEILKSIDLFGTNLSFYIDRQRKHYTKLGGFLTLLWFIGGVLAFIFINYDDFLHNNPISTTSTSKETYRMSNFSMKKYGYLGEFVIINQEHLILEVYYTRLYIIITQLKILQKMP